MKTNGGPTETTPHRAGPSVKSGEGIKIEKAVTINRPLPEVFAFWRNLENLPQFLNHLKSVNRTSEATSHWVAQSEKGRTLEWDAEIIDEKPDELIAWQSLPQGDLKSAGSIRFKPAPRGRGAVVKIALEYAPGEDGGRKFSRVFGRRAGREIARDLFHVKSLLETGEIPTVKGQPAGNKSAHPSNS